MNNYRVFTGLTVILILSVILIAGCTDDKKSPLFSHINFKNPPSAFKPYPLWFWNNTPVDGDTLENQILNFISHDGYGGFAVVPFGKNFSPEYLSEPYFELYGKVLSLAEEKGLHVSLYDEYGFPSGSAGAINADDIARFQNKFPDQTIKRLDKWEDRVSGPANYNRAIDFNGKLLGIVAMDTTTLERENITGNYQIGHLSWEAPKGDWKIMAFLCVADGDPNVDYLSPEAVRDFTGMVHQAYYDRFARYFGTVIKTTFYDEPTMYRAQGRIWTPDFNEKFMAKYGFDPVIYYPALWYDIGEQTYAARSYLFGFRSELYASGFPKAIQEWCNDHHISATGHQDNEEVVNPVSTSGDLMKCFKYVDIPGIDKIGGNRPAEKFYKVISSAAINWDKSLVMSETYGAMGNLSWNEIYHIAMEQYTKGINMLIPHAVWYNDEDVTFKPELSWRNPLYTDGLPEFTLFLSRLNLMLQNNGRVVADIAMLYPIQSMQGEHYLDGPLGYYKGGVEIPDADYPVISKILTNQLGHDFIYLHPEVIDEKCLVEGNQLKLDNKINFESFSLLILPSIKIISLSNLKKIWDFYNSGGNVIFTTQLPAHSSGFNEDDQVLNVMRSFFKTDTLDNNQVLFVENEKGGKVFFIPHPDADAIAKALKKLQVQWDVETENGIPLNYIHKVVENKNIYFFANLGEQQTETIVKLSGKLNLEIRSPYTGEIKKVDCSYDNSETGWITNVKLELPANNSLFVVEK
ncbi:MAG: hypothetical protein K9H58_17405 [Bacteroidales bacterium]|nr:hypothetical protein [Bacteroidales bacterium]